MCYRLLAHFFLYLNVYRFLLTCFTILLRKNIEMMNILLIRIFHIYVWLYLNLTKRDGDTGQNPGPKSNSYQSFSICHWNLNTFLHIILSTYTFKKRAFRLTTWMLYVYQKPILTPEFQMRMRIWKFLVYDLFRGDH